MGELRRAGRAPGPFGAVGTAPKGSEALGVSNVENRSFVVEIPEEDASFVVGPGESLVEAAAREGIAILTACEDGQCGTCVVLALEGEVEHRDRALAPDKRAEGWFCACVSRAAGPRLVLEL